MAKTTKVSFIEYAPLGLKLPVEVDRDTLKFRATFAGTRYEEKDGEVLRERVLAIVKAALQVQWLPVIRVRPVMYTGSIPDNVFGLEVERLYVALLPPLDEQQPSQYKYVHWGAPAASRLEASRVFEWDTGRYGPFQTPWAGRRSGVQEYFLSYNELAWERLHLIQCWVRTIRQQFFAHLTTPEGIASLVVADPQEVFSLFELPMVLPEKK